MIIILMIIILIIFCILFLIFLSQMKRNLFWQKPKHFKKTDNFFDLKYSQNIKENLIIYVLNLKSRPDRKIRMIKHLQHHKIDADFIEAVNGKTLDKKQLLLNLKIDLKSYDKLRMGEIGCYLSHLNIWINFQKQKEKYCLILEDDVILSPNFLNILIRLLNEIQNQNWDLIYLMENCVRYFKQCNEGPNLNKNFFYPKALGYGTYGYVLNKKGCKILIDNALPIREQVDVYINGLNFNGKIKALRIKNPIIHVRNIQDSNVDVSD